MDGNLSLVLCGTIDANKEPSFLRVKGEIVSLSLTSVRTLCWSHVV